MVEDERRLATLTGFCPEWLAPVADSFTVGLLAGELALEERGEAVLIDGARRASGLAAEEIGVIGLSTSA